MATFEHAAPRETTAVTTAEATGPSRFGRWLRRMGWRHAVAIIGVAFALFPVAWIAMSSINSLDSLTTVRFWPRSTTLDNYRGLFEGCSWDWGLPPFTCTSATPFPIWLWNTVKIAFVATSVQLFLSTLAAFSFSRLEWRGRRVGLIGILLLQMFPQFLAFVALFLLLQTLEETFPQARQVGIWFVAVPLLIAGLGAMVAAIRRDWDERARRWAFFAAAFGVSFAAFALFAGSDFGVTLFPKIGLNTHTGLVLVYLGGAIGVNTWLIKGFMDSVPPSLDEAAKVDGASDWQVFSRIILPLAQPIIIVIFIITFVGLYNEFILASVLIRGDVDEFTYATGLSLFVDSQYTAKWGQMTAAALMGSAPIVVMFLIMQDRIVNALQGAVKG